MNLVVDLGNYNTKTNKNVIFKSAFIRGKDINPMGEDIVFVDNEYYTIGKGTFDNKFNKALKNYKPNLCCAIAKSIDEKECSINLMLGVPLDNLGIIDLFKEQLLGKDLEFTFNNDDYKIHINDLKAVGEGVSSFYTFNTTQRAEDLLIIDIGGRTTNVASFEKGKLIKKFTIPLGMLDLFSRIGTKYNNLNGDNKIPEEIERLIDSKYITGVEDEEKQFLDDIMNAIESKLDRRTYKNYYTGGGSERLKVHIENYLQPNGIIMENPLFTNVKGNEVIAKTIWGE